MLKKIAILASILPALLFTKTEANSYSDLSCNPCCDSEWTVYGDWLYWKAGLKNRLDYAVPVNTSAVAIGKVIRIEPTYKSGFRIGCQYECAPVFYDAFYTRFHHSYADNASATPPNTLIPTNEPNRNRNYNFIEADWAVDYDTVDLLVGFSMNRCFCIEGYIFGGLKMAFIDQKFSNLNHIITDESQSFFGHRQRVNMNAYGGNIGLGATYEVLRCFSFFGSTSIDCLAGNFKRTFLLTSGSNLLPFTTIQADINDHFWDMITAINLLFGIKYTRSFSDCWCGHIGLAAGYEFHQYFGIPDFLNYSPPPISGLAISSTHDVLDFSLNGLFVRLSLGF